jgi:hypothetical protein
MIKHRSKYIQNLISNPDLLAEEREKNSSICKEKFV